MPCIFISRNIRIFLPYLVFDCKGPLSCNRGLMLILNSPVKVSVRYHRLEGVPFTNILALWSLSRRKSKACKIANWILPLCDGTLQCLASNSSFANASFCWSWSNAVMDQIFIWYGCSYITIKIQVVLDCYEAALKKCGPQDHLKRAVHIFLNCGHWNLGVLQLQLQHNGGWLLLREHLLEWTVISCRHLRMRSFLGTFWRRKILHWVSSKKNFRKLTRSSWN